MGATAMVAVVAMGRHRLYKTTNEIERPALKHFHRQSSNRRKARAMTDEERTKLAIFTTELETMIFQDARDWKRTIKIDRDLRNLITRACRQLIAKE